MPPSSATHPMSPSSASISRTKWPLPRPPIAGLHDMAPTVAKRWVTSAVAAPMRAAAAAASQPAWPPPITMTSNLRSMAPRSLLDGTRPVKTRRYVAPEPISVSRETPAYRCRRSNASGESLADAEIAEDHLQDFLNIDPAGQSPEGSRRQPKFLGHDILARRLRCFRQRAVERLDRLPQRHPMALPGDQHILTRPERVAGMRRQRRDEVVYPGAGQRRHGIAIPPLSGRRPWRLSRARIDQVDLVPNHPQACRTHGRRLVLRRRQCSVHYPQHQVSRRCPRPRPAHP